jgi:hypothetical protein
MSETRTISGRVAKVRGRGFTLEGQPDVGADGWLNISQFGKARDLDVPNVGDEVEVALDAKNFVRDLTVRTPAAPSRTAPSASHTSFAGGDGDRICRQAVMNTATAILASGGRQVRPSAMLRLAVALERWARDGGPIDHDDAFDDYVLGAYARTPEIPEIFDRTKEPDQTPSALEPPPPTPIWPRHDVEARALLHIDLAGANLDVLYDDLTRLARQHGVRPPIERPPAQALATAIASLQRQLRGRVAQQSHLAEAR